MPFNHPEFEAVIGLEIHAQLTTTRKLFCFCSTAYGADANQNTCPVCTAQPGALPVLNQDAIDLAILAGLALNCSINRKSVFSRKNYFYPDLPKGYQISQYDQPLCSGGYVETFVGESPVRVNIERIHVEEDAGQSQHHHYGTLINLNRASTPLIEIVSRPEIYGAEEAAAYMREVKNILVYVGVNDGNLQEGSLRCDANVSIRPKGQRALGTRTEIKNVNSFRFLEKAIDYEIARQIQVVVAGGRIVQETRGYDSGKNVTYSMRSKEDAHDYRYFPEPDLLPLFIEQSRIEKISSRMIELPQARASRYAKQHDLPLPVAATITASRAMADYYDGVVSLVSDGKLVANWVVGPVLRAMKDRMATEAVDGEATDRESSADPSGLLAAARLAQLLNLIKSGAINNNIAKTVFEELLKSPLSAEEIVNQKGLGQVSDQSVINKAIDYVLMRCADQVAEYRSGKEKVFGFLVGQVMRELKGKANPTIINDILKKKL
jgi:aspartyl-tRNA(Asn)/glutamyl-tRNA(Gln) amidotransferase subunit B